MLGKGCRDNLLRHVDENGVDLCIEGCPLSATIEDGKVREARVFMHHKSGHRVHISVKSLPLRNESGKIIAAVEIFNRVNVLRDLPRELELLRREVLTDPLTEVGNRRCMDIAAEQLEKTTDDENKFGILFADLDRFKFINDEWGHEMGDNVLRMVAATLSSALRPSDLASRWGGEEFVILVPDIDAHDLAVLAERLRKLVELSWVDSDNECISVTASFGGALSEPGESVCAVIDRADRQAYLSKDAGRNCVHINGVNITEEASREKTAGESIPRCLM